MSHSYKFRSFRPLYDQILPSLLLFFLLAPFIAPGLLRLGIVQIKKAGEKSPAFFKVPQIMKIFNPYACADTSRQLPNPEHQHPAAPDWQAREQAEIGFHRLHSCENHNSNSEDQYDQ